MGHISKDMTFTNVAMMDLKCSPLCRFEDMGRHPHVHHECFQDQQKTIQSSGEHHRFQILDLNLIPVPLGDG
jgi:hypothetical protein